MAGTVTTSEIRHGSVKLVKFEWTSAASGAADATATGPYTGNVVLFITDPGATAPSVDYDVVITDNNTFDVLLGAGADRHTANTETVQEASLGYVVESPLTLAITNAGDSKEGTVYLYIR